MKIPAELAKFNLQYAKREIKRRLICTSEGGPGSGKTSLFYRTAPRPALVIQLDHNDEGVREDYRDDEDIVFQDIFMQPFIVHDVEQRQKDMKVYTEQFRDLYMPSVSKGYFRSIMIDEGAALYMMTRRAFLEDLGFGGSSQQSYAPVNAAMDRIFTLARQNRVNLYIPHRQTDEREDGVSAAGKKTSTPTGNKVAQGWKQTGYTAQVHLLLEKDQSFSAKACGDCGLPKVGKRSCNCDKFVKQYVADKFTAKIIKCTARTSVEGEVLRGSDITWQNLGQLVFPHSEESEWV